jgi:hypothetical protein
MRTTIELPDELLTRAKVRAAQSKLSLRQFFVDAVEQKLAPSAGKTRRPPPAVGNARGPKIMTLTREQVDEAMFG